MQPQQHSIVYSQSVHLSALGLIVPAWLALDKVKYEAGGIHVVKNETQHLRWETRSEIAHDARLSCGCVVGVSECAKVKNACGGLHMVGKSACLAPHTFTSCELSSNNGQIKWQSQRMRKLVMVSTCVKRELLTDSTDYLQPQIFFDCRCTAKLSSRNSTYLACLQYCSDKFHSLIY